jgi:RNA polymerase sigma-70 factor (ECF subfamily)
VESLDALLPRFNCDGRLERLDLDYGSGARAEEVLERKELAEKARAAIDLLPEGIRAAFVLHDLEGLSTKEAAEVLGIEPGALRTRLHRARLVLRAYLGKITGGA